MPESLPRVGSAVILRDEANRILLGQRNKDPQRGSWILPGGKIHAFETVADAAARELREETGLEIKLEGLFGVYEIVQEPSEHRIVIYSWARAIGGHLRASDDVSDVRFVALDELGTLPLTPLVRRVLGDAGFLDQPRHETAAPTQLTLIPVPLVAATIRAPRRSPSRRSQRRMRCRRLVWNTPLLFDDTDRLSLNI